MLWYAWQGSFGDIIISPKPKENHLKKARHTGARVPGHKIFKMGCNSCYKLLVLLNRFNNLNIITDMIAKTIKLILCLLLIACFNAKAQQTEEQKKAEAWANFQKMIEERIHKDWAWIKRYESDNEKLPPPAAGEKRVIFMGNSITEGWINTDPDFFKGRPYINRGIGGQ